MQQLQGDLRFYYETLGPADIKTDGAQPDRDAGLENAALISIFTDRRADVSDALPDQGDTRLGWWGDTLATTPVGSRQWLLRRRKLTGATLADWEQWVLEALDWMKQSGVADTLKVKASRDPNNPNRAEMAVQIIRNAGPNLFFKYYYNWQSQIFGGVNNGI